MQKLLEPPTHAPAEPCGCTSCANLPRSLARVHLFSGEFFETAEDLRIRGRGLDFVWARKYRSRLGPNTAQGNRWDFSYNIQVEAASDDTLKLFNGDGREDVFARQPDGTYALDSCSLWAEKITTARLLSLSLIMEPGTSSKLTTALSKISEIVDRNSNRLVFRYDMKGRYAYDPLNRAISETYADGTVQSYTCDVHGNRLTSTDPNGSMVKTSYDLLNRPIRRSIVPGEGVSKLVTQESYEYDALSRLTLARNDHSVVIRSYDSLSNVVREQLNERRVAFVYDGVGNKRRCTYPSGREITFDYDELNRKTKIADARGTIATYRTLARQDSTSEIRDLNGLLPTTPTMKLNG